jgi:hypothetical protein
LHKQVLIVEQTGVLSMPFAPISDSIIVALSQMVDDAQTGKRDPSHSDLDFEIKRSRLTEGDPKKQGITAGKAKRVKSVLSWAIENDPAAGQEFVANFVALLRGHGGFRDTSPNFVGKHIVENAAAVFSSEGYELTLDGHLQPRMLDNLSGVALGEALETYVRRAKRGSADAALVTGTGKDLLEAVAGHILQQHFGSYSPTSNFPTLLGQTFIALNLATSADAPAPGEPANRRIERAMYELACGINQLRNKQGTGHGRPWLPSVTEAEARMAIESMGVIAERLLNLHRGNK